MYAEVYKLEMASGLFDKKMLQIKTDKLYKYKK